MEKIKLLDVANPRNTKDTTNALITTLNEIAEKADTSVAQIKINAGEKIEPDSLKYTLTLINHNGVESSVDLIIPNITDPIYDDILSDTSENAVQNKVIKTHIDSILAQADSTISYFAISAGTEVTGGLQYTITITYLDGHQETQFLFIPRPRIEVDSAMDSTSSNPVQNKVIKEYIDTEVSQLSNELTFKLDMQVGDENETNVYGYTGVAQKTITVSNTPQESAIPAYNENNTLKTDTPLAGNDCVNLQHLRDIANNAVGFTEQITLPADTWVTDATNETYKYTNTVNLLYPLSDYTMLELLNNIPETFSKYGFAILQVHTQADSGYPLITIGAVEQPTEGHILDILIKPIKGWADIVWQ